MNEPNIARQDAQTPHEQMQALTAIPAKYVPFHGRNRDITVVRASKWRLIDHPEATPRDIPVPTEQAFRHYAKSDGYLDSGQNCFTRMEQILALVEWTLEPGFRVLDLGCAAGRMTRWFLDHQRNGGEVWGTDLDAPCIYWAQRHMSPPFRFVVTSSYPHLPFDQGYFDLITGWSVFTHIDDMTDAWVLELRRVLSERGRIYITINDDESVRKLLHDDKWKTNGEARAYEQMIASTRMNDEDWLSISLGLAPYSRVYHNRAHLLERFGLYFSSVQAFNAGYGFQSCYVLRR